MSSKDLFISYFFNSCLMIINDTICKYAIQKQKSEIDFESVFFGIFGKTTSERNKALSNISHYFLIFK